MRKLIILTGPPGSGKSHLAHQMGWTPYLLNQDTLRLLYRTPEMDSSGKLNISQDENQKVFNDFKKFFQKRLERGEFIVLEGIFMDPPLEFIEEAQKWLYDVVVFNGWTIPEEQARAQNDQREEWKKLSKPVLDNIFNKYHQKQNFALNHPGMLVNQLADISIINWKADGSHVVELKQISASPVVDLSHYKEIVHIGDLQGCHSVLFDGGPFTNGIDEETCYIFVGDLLDRGIENGKVLKWFKEEMVPRDNVVLVWGNHENHLLRWGHGWPAVSTEFELKTLPQLEEAGVTKEDALAVCKKAKDALFYGYHDQKIMVTHAGLPTVPVQPELISLRQYSSGTGYWNDPIDQQFERNAPIDWCQVHGHRNHGWQPIQATTRSFNLEDQVEFGGRLRWVSLSQKGWELLSNKNKIYDLEGAMKLERKKIKWSTDSIQMSEDTYQKMINHAGVKEKTLSAHPHIVSYNFSKDVFFNAAWDEVVVKARGFFVNQKTKEIVSRGYDKFFNINERPETEISVLAQNTAYPVIGYVKENGFLGNLGYDRETDELFVATKSSSSGDFSDWFKEILKQKLSPEKIEGLTRWLRDNDACMTFEVVDPINDPHMIDYDEKTLYLLDVFHRAESAERLGYEELKQVGSKFGLTVKEKGITFGNAMALQKWFERSAFDLNWRYHNRDIEGFVFEDANKNMFKVKMASYAFWKKMRGQKDRMLREWDKIETAGMLKNNKTADLIERGLLVVDPTHPDPNKRDPWWNAAKAKQDWMRTVEQKMQHIQHPAHRAFVSWCAQQDPSVWKKSIIDIRKDFLATNPDPSIWLVPFSHEPEEQHPEMRKKQQDTVIKGERDLDDPSGPERAVSWRAVR